MLRGALSQYARDLMHEVTAAKAAGKSERVKALCDVLDHVVYLLEASHKTQREFILYTNEGHTKDHYGRETENAQIVDFMLAPSIEEAAERAARMYGPEWSSMVLVQTVGRHYHVYTDSDEGDELDDDRKKG